MNPIFREVSGFLGPKACNRHGVMAGNFIKIFPSVKNVDTSLCFESRIIGVLD